MSVTWTFYQRALDLLRFRSRHYKKLFNLNDGSAKAVMQDDG